MPEKYKIVLFGAVGVGKSAMTVKYISNRFITEYDPYIDCKYSKLDLIDSERIQVRIWDTYTHAKTTDDLYRYIKWSDGIAVVFSLTCRQSFIVAETFLRLIREACYTRGIDMIPTILVGNKFDLTSQRQVNRLEACELSARYTASKYLECSAARNLYSVEAVFHSLVQDIKWRRGGNSNIQLLSPTYEEKLSNSWSGSLPKNTGRRVAVTGSPPILSRLQSSKLVSPKLPLKKSNSTLKLFETLGLKLFSG